MLFLFFTSAVCWLSSFHPLRWSFLSLIASLKKKKAVVFTKTMCSNLNALLQWCCPQQADNKRQWCHYLPLTDCVSCPGRVYERQKRTEACAIHPVHRLIMSLNKHVRQRAAGLRGKTIGHWPRPQIPTSVDEGLRDVLAPFDSPTVQKVSCSQQAQFAWFE